MATKLQNLGHSLTLSDPSDPTTPVPGSLHAPGSYISQFTEKLVELIPKHDVFRVIGYIIYPIYPGLGYMVFFGKKRDIWGFGYIRFRGYIRLYWRIYCVVHLQATD